MVGNLPEDAPRYLVFDKPTTTRSIKLFIEWNPVSAPVREQMMYTSGRKDMLSVLGQYITRLEFIYAKTKADLAITELFKEST